MFNNDLENILYDNEQFNDFSLEPKLLFDCSNYFIENKDCNSLSDNNYINNDKEKEDYQISNNILEDKKKVDISNNNEEKTNLNNINPINLNNKNINKNENNITIKKTEFTTKPKLKSLIFKINKINKKEIKKVLGRKRKNNKNYIMGKHNKYSSDNIIRKIKLKLLDSILYCLNSTFQKEKKIKCNKAYSAKIFLKIDQNIVKNINVNNMLKMLKSKIKDIFSENISKKYINYPLDYNEILIKNIYAEKIHIKTISILDMTLFQCLEHFRGSKYYNELDSLEENYNMIINEFKYNGETEEYINKFKDLVDTFEEYFKSRTPRKID